MSSFDKVMSRGFGREAEDSFDLDMDVRGAEIKPKETGPVIGGGQIPVSKPDVLYPPLDDPMEENLRRMREDENHTYGFVQTLAFDSKLPRERELELVKELGPCRERFPFTVDPDKLGDEASLKLSSVGIMREDTVEERRDKVRAFIEFEEMRAGQTIYPRKEDGSLRMTDQEMAEELYRFHKTYDTDKGEGWERQEERMPVRDWPDYRASNSYDSLSSERPEDIYKSSKESLTSGVSTFNMNNIEKSGIDDSKNVLPEKGDSVRWNRLSDLEGRFGDVSNSAKDKDDFTP